MHRLTGRSFAGFTLLLFLFLSGFFSSCISTKKVLYFTDIPDSATAAQPVVINTVKYTDPLIQPNDILVVTVQTIAQNESSLPISTSSTSVFNPLVGFLVDKNGNIELSLIGFVKVGGLSTAEAREFIKQKAREYYKEPVVNVRIANFDVQLLGEFARPGPVSFPAEKATILDAVSAGGDLLITGKRNNILMIRAEGDTRKFFRFSMNSTDMFRSPYFYLRQRDVLYAEPSPYKVQNSDNRLSRTVTIVGGLISLAALFLSFRTK
ncbi:MAG: polysaccharide biosynthesis/export family protein [Taibaiella sp.]|nr:polysaccharide biosynthesis/export family protein [Taibaiella sp.]